MNADGMALTKVAPGNNGIDILRMPASLAILRTTSLVSLIHSRTFKRSSAL